MAEEHSATQAVIDEPDPDPEPEPAWKKVILEYLQTDALALRRVMDYVMARTRQQPPPPKTGKR